jgi:YD repeat-containing protein
MTIAAKHLDPLVGLDTHIILIPTPAGPVPTPLPHPYIGILFDPFDYAPFVGASTYINGLPRGVAGTNGKAVPPHIPMGGPFAKPPTNESEIFLGSVTVLTDGDPQSFLGLPVLSCQDIGMPAPPRPKKKSVAKTLLLPTTVILCILMGMLVLIGGPPTVSMMAIAQKLGLGALKKFKKGKLMRKLSKKLHKLADKLCDKLKLGKRARNAVHKAICTVTGHPVDVATGKVLTDRVDFRLDGPIPIEWERTWFSSSLFDEGVVLYRTGDGRHIGLPQLAEGGEFFDLGERLTLLRDRTGYAIRSSDGLVRRFVRVPGRPVGEAPLAEMRDVAGNQVRFFYDTYGRLTQIVDSAGRIVDLASDQNGRITAIALQHPEIPGQRVYGARYAYDDFGNLTGVWDALGQVAVNVYQHHLLVKETDRNGLSFYFAYDVAGPEGRCVRTWGDGGIYDHKLSYVGPDVTVVEDSLGHKTTYTHDGAVVTRSVDPLGAVRETEYDDSYRVLSETDPLGRKTRYAYDERGNLAKTVGPDGAAIELTNGPHDRLVRAVDPIGGEWSWTREPNGRLLEVKDPEGRTTQYHHQGTRLIGITDPAGGRTAIEYDSAGNPSTVVTPDGAATYYEYDLRGRVVRITDVLGNVQRREFDLLDRVQRVSEPDGNVHELAYDAEGNVVRAKDQHPRGWDESRRAPSPARRFTFGTTRKSSSSASSTSTGSLFGSRSTPTVLSRPRADSTASSGATRATTLGA